MTEHTLIQQRTRFFCSRETSKERKKERKKERRKWDRQLQREKERKKEGFFSSWRSRKLFQKGDGK